MWAAFYIAVMLTASAALSLFLMLALASITYYFAQRFKLPFTVLLTFVGAVLVPISMLGPLGFIRDFTLTPELLFFIFLPTLLFESAFNMNIRRIVDEFTPIMLLAIVGYLVSSFTIGAGLWWVLGLMSIQIPFIITLLFGALISATDPVAVLALFKEYGAPRRLSLIFEGESLMNDATALALFLIVLGLVEHGVSPESLGEGTVIFTTMLVGGAVFGAVFGGLMAKLVGVFRNNEFVAVTLMIVLAHLTFLIAEIANHSFEHAGVEFLKLSPIIATTVASLVMGNYGRFKVSPRAEAFVEKFWTQFAFMANSIVFILVGLLLATVPEEAFTLILPVFAAVLVVAAARALSIYGTILPFNLCAKKQDRIPISWQHLLAWGSLRGALAVMLVLLIPADLAVPSWTLPVSVRDFMLVVTVACIFVTLFIKAPLVGPLMRRLKVGALSALEKTAYQEARAIVHATTLQKLREYTEKKYVPPRLAEKLFKEHESHLTDSYAKFHAAGTGCSEITLRLYLIGREKEVLKHLLAFDEVTETVFKRIYGKLTIQAEDIEAGRNVDPSRCYDYRDIFDNVARWLRVRLHPETPEEAATEQYLYYRAQEILTHKVLKEIDFFANKFPTPIFGKRALTKIEEEYRQYKDEAHHKREAVRAAYPDTIHTLDEALAFRSIFRVEESTLEMLAERELLTPKLFVQLKDEYEEAVRETKIGRNRAQL